MVSNINGVGLTQGVNSVKPAETAPKTFSEPEKLSAKNVDEYIPARTKNLSDCTPWKRTRTESFP